jgi:hypothetical protein
MTTTHSASTIGLDTVADLAAQLRVDSIRSSTSAGSGHPTSSMSAALKTEYSSGEAWPLEKIRWSLTGSRG